MAHRPGMYLRGAILAFALACDQASTGPVLRPRAAMLVQPTWANPLSAGAPVDRARVTARSEEGLLVADTVVPWPTAADSLQLSLPISLTSGAVIGQQEFLVTFKLIGVTGDTLFSGGPLIVRAVRIGNPPIAPLTIPLVYSGPGRSAKTLTAIVQDTAVAFGDSIVLTALARDTAGSPLPGTLVAWTSLDTNKIRVKDKYGGKLGGRTTRGVTQVIASTLTGQKDTVNVTSQPVAAILSLVSGSGQSGVTSTVLPVPLRVRVKAADSLGVRSIPVTFAVTGGGGTLSSTTVFTDTLGFAQVTQTLGATVGPVIVTASVASVAGSPVTFTQGATSGPPAKLAFAVGPPASSSAGAAFTPALTVQVQDVAGNLVTSATNTVTVAIGANPGGGTLSGTLSAAAVAGVATFPGLSIDKTGTGYTLAASSATLASATSASFSIVPGAAASLAFITGPTSTNALIAISPAVVIAVIDAFGNTVTGATTPIVMSILGGSGTAGAVLGGTFTVPAVGGLATFSTLTIDKVGTGYRVSASATALTSAVSAPFNIAPGAPALLAFQAAPPASATSLAAFPTVVEVRDAANNVVTSATNTVLLGLSTAPAGGAISGTVSVAAVAGVATFSGVVLDRAGAYAITASSAGLTPAVSGGITLNPGAAAALAFDAAGAPAASATNGTTLPTQPIVKVVDASGNTVTSASGTMTATIVSGTGGSLVNATATITAGVATFGGLQLNGTAGAFTLRFSDGTRTVNSASITLGVGAAAAVVFDATGTPGAAATNGTNLPTQPIVKVVDASGNLVTSAGGTMTATIFSGTGGSLVSATAPITAGVATFTSLQLNGTAGAFTLQFSDGTRTVNSVPIALGVGTASAVVFDAAGTPGAAATNGTNLPTQPVVRVVDASGNLVTGASGTMTATIAAGAAGSLVNATAPITAGVATFTSLQLNGTAGAFTLQFSDGTRTVNSASITLGFGAAAAVVFDAAGTPAAAATNGTNLPTQPIVKVVDASGNLVTSASGTTTATIVSGTGGSLVNATASITAGVATFSGLQLNGTAGAFTLRFSDGTRTVNSVSITLGVGAASAVVFDAAGTPGAAATNGTNLPTQPIVKVVDASGNLVPSASGTMTATIFSGTGGSLVSATAPITAGVATFSGLQLNGTVGAFVLRFSDGTRTVSSVSIALGFGAAAAVIFDAAGTPGSAATNGTSLPTQPIVTVVDASGNLVTSASGTMTSTIAAGAGGSLVNATAPITAGVATFSGLQLNGTAGAFTLQFSDGTRTVNSVAISLGVGAAAAVVFDAAGTPGSSAANGTNLPTQPIVKVVDASGNTVTSAGGTMTATIASGTGGSLINVAAGITAGVATYTSLRLQGTAGNFTLAFSDGTRSITTGTVTLAVGAASTVAFDAAGTPGAAATNGTNLPTQPIVKVLDVGGNTVTGASGTMTATIASGTGGSLVNATAPITAGVAAFSGFQLNGTTGSFALQFSDGTRTVNSGSIALGVGAASSVSFDAAGTPGAAATNGTNLPTQPIVKVLDVGANLVTGASGTMTATIVSGTGGSLVNATAPITAGVATFSGLQLNGTAGTFVLRFSDGVRTVNSVSITLGVGAASAVVFDAAGTPAATATNGTSLPTQPIVRVVDASGNLVTSAGGTMTATIVSGSGGSLVNATAPITGGVATFIGLQLNGLAGAFTLQFSDGTRTVSSVSIALGAGAASAVVFDAAGTPAASATNGTNLPTQPIVKVVDASGNTVPGASGTMTATILSGSGGSLVNTTAPITAGVATFSGFQLNGIAGAFTLQFSDGTRTVNSVSITLGAGAASAVVFDATGTPGAAATNGTNLPTQPIVKVVDASGNTVPSASGTITATIATGSGGSLINASAGLAAGVATYTSLRLQGTAGNFTLTFSDGTRSVTTGTIALGVGAASSVAFDAAGTPGAAATVGTNLPTQPIVKVLDVGGNVVTGAGGTMTASIASGTGGSLTNATAPITAGVATFSGFQLNGTIGAFTLQFSDGTRTVNSVSITLGFGAALGVSFDAAGTPASTATNGTNLPIQPIVNVVDFSGNIVTSASGTMTATIVAGTGGSLVNATSPITAGVATFSGFRLNGTAGNFRLRFSDGTRQITTPPITLAAGAASAVVFDAAGMPGSSATNGTNLPTQPIVKVVDASGNTVPGAGGTMTATIVAGTGGSLVNATAPITAGVATFSGFQLNGLAGAFTLQFSDGTRTVNSVSIALGAGAAAAVVFDAAGTPGAVATNGTNLPTQPIVKVVDASGNTVPGASGTMTATILSGSGGSLVNATAPITAGVATFSGFQLNGTAGAFTLQFSDGTRTVNSVAISLGVGAAAAVVFDAAGTPGSSATNGTNLPTQPIVRVLDVGGNTVTSASGTITATIASGTGGSLINASAGITAGVATYTSLRLQGTAGSFTLSFSDGTRSVTTGAIALAVGAASTVAFDAAGTPGAAATSGADLPTQPIVKVLDVGGNTVTGASGTMTASIVSGTGGSLVNATAPITAGVATFSGLQLSGTIGSFTLQFSDGTRTVNSVSITLGAGAASAVAFDAVGTPGSSATNGTNLPTQPIVKVVDASGNTVPGASGTMTATILSGSGGSLVNATAPITAGVATFSGFQLNGTAGAFTLQFSDGTRTVNSVSIALGAGAASAVVFDAAGTPGAVATNGTNLPTQPIVRVVDASGNTVPSATGTMTATILSGTGGSLVNATAPITAGVATFSGFQLNGLAGAFTLQFSDGTRTVSSGSITLGFGAASAVAFASGGAPGATATNGTNLPTQPIVKVVDASGNTVTSATGTMTATILSGTGGSLVNATAPITAGVATFSGFQLNGTAGAFTLQFSDGTRTVNSVSIALGAGAASAVIFDAAGTPGAVATNGTNLPTQPIVKVVDASGNTVPGASGTMTATILSGSGGSLVNATAPITAGVAIFSGFQLNGTAGAFTLQFSDGTRTVNSVSIALGAGAASAVVFGAAGTPGAVATNGTNLPTQPIVRVVDASGNTVPSASGTMTATILSGTGGSLVNATAPITAGVATFSGFQLNGLAGAFTLQFSDGTRTVSSGSITLGFGAASAVAFASGGAPGATATNGTNLPTQPIVKVVDASGNTVTSATGTMTATILSGTGGSLVNATAPITAGVATFSGFQLNGLAGAFTLQFSDGTRTVNSVSIALGAGAASAVVFDAAGTPGAVATNGTNLPTQPIVKVVDASGNLVTAATGTMTVTILSGTGGSLVNATAPITAGVATFSGFQLNGTAGAFTLQFSDGTRTVNSVSIALGAGAASAVVFGAAGTPGAVATNGTNLPTQPIVRVVDASGNLVTAATGTMTATILSGTGGSLVNATAPISAGVATFSGFQLNGLAGAFTLRFSDGTRTVNSVSITLGAGAASAVAFASGGTPALTATNGTNLPTQPIVKVVDASGNTVTSATGTVTATILSGTGGSLVNATAPITAGVASFSGFQLNGTAGNFTLRFSDGTRTVDRGPITLGAGAAASVAFDPAGTPVGTATSLLPLPVQPIVNVLDASGNIVTSASGTMTATIFSGTGGTLVNPTATITAGVATFVGLELNGTAGVFVLRFSDGTRSVNSVSIILSVIVGP